MIGSTNACGGMVDNEELTALKENVLEDRIFLGYESDEPIVGTMPNNGETSDQSLNCGEQFVVKRGYHAKDFKIKGNSLASQTSGTATAAQILKDKTAWINGQRIVGTMPNNPAQNATLKCGQSKIIPKGYTPGGTILAANLASQTPGTATRNKILSGTTAWVNGERITGSMENIGAIDTVKSIGSDGTNCYFRMSSGAHITNASSGFPELKVSYENLRSMLGITPDIIKKGVSCLGITGTSEGYSLAGVNDLYNRGTFAEGVESDGNYTYLEPTKIRCRGGDTATIRFYLKKQLNLNNYNYINIELCNKCICDDSSNKYYMKQFDKEVGIIMFMDFYTVANRNVSKKELVLNSVYNGDKRISIYYGETKTISLYIHDNEITNSDIENKKIKFGFYMKDRDANDSAGTYYYKDGTIGLEIYRIWLS